MNGITREEVIEYTKSVISPLCGNRVARNRESYIRNQKHDMIRLPFSDEEET